MAKITPPLQKGERRNPATQVTIYQASVDILDKLVERKNTRRIEYLRWLLECAEAGLVGPAENSNLEHERDGFVTAVLDGQMTWKEARGVLNRMLRRACVDQRAHDEAEWAGVNDAD